MDYKLWEDAGFGINGQEQPVQKNRGFFDALSDFASGTWANTSSMMDSTDLHKLREELLHPVAGTTPEEYEALKQQYRDLYNEQQQTRLAGQQAQNRLKQDGRIGEFAAYATNVGGSLPSMGLNLVGHATGSFPITNVLGSYMDAESAAIESSEKVLSEGGTLEQAEMAFKNALPKQIATTIPDTVVDQVIWGGIGKKLGLGKGAIDSAKRFASKLKDPATRIGSEVAFKTGKKLLGKGAGVLTDTFANVLSENVQEGSQNYVSDVEAARAMGQDVDYSLGDFKDSIFSKEGIETIKGTTAPTLLTSLLGGAIKSNQYLSRGAETNVGIKTHNAFNGMQNEKGIKLNPQARAEQEMILSKLRGFSREELASWSDADIVAESAVAMGDMRKNITGEESDISQIREAVDTLTRLSKDQNSITKEGEITEETRDLLTRMGLDEKDINDWFTSPTDVLAKARQVEQEEQAKQKQAEQKEEKPKTTIKVSPETGETLNVKQGEVVQGQKPTEQTTDTQEPITEKTTQNGLGEQAKQAEQQGTIQQDEEVEYPDSIIGWERDYDADNRDGVEYEGATYYSLKDNSISARIEPSGNGFTVIKVDEQGNATSDSKNKNFPSLKAAIDYLQQNKGETVFQGSDEQAQAEMPSGGVDATKGNSGTLVGSVEDLYNLSQQEPDLINPYEFAEFVRIKQHMGAGDLDVYIDKEHTGQFLGEDGQWHRVNAKADRPETAKGRAIIQLYKGGDLGSAIHEIAHTAYWKLSDADKRTFGYYAIKTQGKYIADSLDEDYTPEFENRLLKLASKVSKNVELDEQDKQLQEKILDKAATNQIYDNLITFYNSKMNGGAVDLKNLTTQQQRAIEERWAWEMSQWYVEGYSVGVAPSNIIERIKQRGCESIAKDLNSLARIWQHIHHKDNNEIENIYRSGQAEQQQEQAEQTPNINVQFTNELERQAMPNVNMPMSFGGEQAIQYGVPTLGESYNDAQEYANLYNELDRRYANRQKMQGLPSADGSIPTVQNRPTQAEEKKTTTGYKERTTSAAKNKREAEKLVKIIEGRKSGWEKALEKLAYVDPKRFRSIKIQDGNDLWNEQEEQRQKQQQENINNLSNTKFSNPEMEARPLPQTNFTTPTLKAQPMNESVTRTNGINTGRPMYFNPTSEQTMNRMETVKKEQEKNKEIIKTIRDLRDLIEEKIEKAEDLLKRKTDDGRLNKLIREINIELKKYSGLKEFNKNVFSSQENDYNDSKYIEFFNRINKIEDELAKDLERQRQDEEKRKNDNKKKIEYVDKNFKGVKGLSKETKEVVYDTYKALLNGNDQVSSLAKENAVLYARICDRIAKIYNENEGENKYTAKDIYNQVGLKIQDKKGSSRGSFSYSPRKIGGRLGKVIEIIDKMINTYSNASPSTFLHETTHMYYHELEVIANKYPTSQAAKDYKTLLEFTKYKGAKEEMEYANLLGAQKNKIVRNLIDKVESANGEINRFDALETYRQEKLAQSFEEYLRTGNAPTNELKDVFKRFKEWILNFFGSTMQDVGIKPSPEVKEFFDKMVMTDEEIQQKKQQEERQQKITSSVDEIYSHLYFGDKTGKLKYNPETKKIEYFETEYGAPELVYNAELNDYVKKRSHKLVKKGEITPEQYNELKQKYEQDFRKVKGEKKENAPDLVEGMKKEDFMYSAYKETKRTEKEKEDTIKELGKENQGLVTGKSEEYARQNAAEESFNKAMKGESLSGMEETELTKEQKKEVESSVEQELPKVEKKKTEKQTKTNETKKTTSKPKTTDFLSALHKKYKYVTGTPIGEKGYRFKDDEKAFIEGFKGMIDGAIGNKEELVNVAKRLDSWFQNDPTERNRMVRKYLSQYLADAAKINNKQNTEVRHQLSDKAQEAQNILDKAFPNTRFQYTWHSTPHDFNEFTLKHLLSGEGYMIHGWGLYFGDVQPIKKNYFDRPKRLHAKDIKDMRLLKVSIPENDVLLKEDAGLKDQTPFVQKQLLKLLQDVSNSSYEEVMQIIDEYNESSWEDEREEYNDFYSLVRDFIRNNNYKCQGETIDEKTSRLLNKYGIKGIQYDGEYDGDGQRCFVVFDNKSIDIISKFKKEDGKWKSEKVDNKRNREVDKQKAQKKLQKRKEYEKKIHEEAVKNKEILDKAFPNTRFQFAWHGTYTDFNKFTLKKLSSGAGDQWYGWGLYFSVEPRIGKRYYDMMQNQFRPEQTDKDFEYHIEYNGQKFEFEYDDSVGKIENPKLGNRNISEEMAAVLFGFIERYRNNVRGFDAKDNVTIDSILKKELKTIQKSVVTFRDDKNIQDFYIKQLKFMKELIKNKDKIIVKENPDRERIMFCHIPDDKYMLDRGRKLKNQPKSIQRAILDIWKEVDPDGLRKADGLPNEQKEFLYKMLDVHDPLEYTGKFIYNELSKKISSDYGLSQRASEEVVSKYMLQHGIQGLKYVDEYDGDARVVFNDEAITILDKFYKYKGKWVKEKNKLTDEEKYKEDVKETYNAEDSRLKRDMRNSFKKSNKEGKEKIKFASDLSRRDISDMVQEVKERIEKESDEQDWSDNTDFSSPDDDVFFDQETGEWVNENEDFTDFTDIDEEEQKINNNIPLVVVQDKEGNLKIVNKNGVPKGFTIIKEVDEETLTGKTSPNFQLHSEEGMEKADTNSPAFKNWFKGSILKNEDGSPKVMYRGIDQHYNPEFDKEEGGIVWITDDIEHAKSYRDSYLDTEPTFSTADKKKYEQTGIKEYTGKPSMQRMFVEEGSRQQEGDLLEAYANIKNPFNMGIVNDKKSPHDTYVDIGKQLKKDVQNGIITEQQMRQVLEDLSYLNKKDKNGNYSTRAVEVTTHFAKKKFWSAFKNVGYDSVKGTENGINNTEGKNVYGVFDKGNVKSIYNNGTFDKNNKDVRYQLASEKGRPLANINTQKFKNWFGNSTAINTDGTPRVFYRGQEGRYDPNYKFDKTDANRNKLTWVAQTKEFVKRGAYNGVDGDGDLWEVYIRTENPFNMGQIDYLEGAEKNPKQLYEHVIKKLEKEVKYRRITKKQLEETKEKLSYLREGKRSDGVVQEEGSAIYYFLDKDTKLVGALKDLGYDSILGIEDGTNTFALFSPNQVKSIYNNGDFDNNNNDIRYQKSDENQEKKLTKKQEKKLEIQKEIKEAKEKGQTTDTYKDVYSVSFTKSAQESKVNQEKMKYFDERKSAWERHEADGRVTYTRTTPFEHHQKVITYNGINDKIVEKKPKKKYREWLDFIKEKVTKNLFNDQYALYKLATDMGLGDTYMRMIVTQGYVNKTGVALEKGIKYNGKRTRGLNEIAREIGEEKQPAFCEYAIAKHLQDIYNRPKNKIEQKYNKDEVDAVIKRVEASEDYELFERCRKDLVEYNHAVFHVLLDGGIITEQEFQKYIERDKNYVPLAKLMDKEDFGFNSIQYARSMINVGSPIKTLGSSKREIKNIFAEMQKRTAIYYAAASRNKAGQIFVNEICNNLDKMYDGDTVSRGASVIRKVKVKTEDGKLITRPDADKQIFYINNGGKHEFYQVSDPEIYRALRHLDEEQLHIINGMLEKILSAPASLIRATATSTPDFGIRNLIRDNITAFYTSEHGFIPLVDALWGMREIKRNGEFYQKYIDQVGDYGLKGRGKLLKNNTYKPTDYRENLKDEIKKNYDILVDSKRSLKDRTNALLKMTIGAPFFAAGKQIETFNMYLEQGTRVGEFKNAKMGYNGLIDRITSDLAVDIKNTRQSDIISAYKAQDVTLYFAQHGLLGGKFNRFVTFLNASLLGAQKFLNAVDLAVTGKNSMNQKNTRLQKEMLFKVVLNTAFAIGLSVAGHGDEDYDEAPEYEKDTFWIFPDGFRLSKDEIYGRTVGTAIQRAIDQYYKEGKIDVLKTFGAIASVFKPSTIMPAVLDMFYGAIYNKDSFTGREIVPEYMIHKVGYQQKDIYTGNFAADFTEVLYKAFGINLSAKRVDWALQKNLTNAKKYIDSVYDIKEKYTDPEHFNEKMARGYDKNDSTGKFIGGLRDDVPPILNLITGTFATNRSQYQSISDFEKKYYEIKQIADNDKDIPMTPEQRRKWKKYQDAYKQYAKLRKQLKAIRSNASLNKTEKREKAQPIFEKQKALAKWAEG